MEPCRSRRLKFHLGHAVRHSEHGFFLWLRLAKVTFVVPRNEFPMPVGVTPPIGIVSLACRFADIEIRVNFPYTHQYVFVEFFLGDRPLSASMGIQRFDFVFVIQSKRHCSENDV